MPQFKNYDRISCLYAFPLGCQVGINARHLGDGPISLGFDEMVLDFVHPETVAGFEVDPARFKTDVYYDELHGAEAEQVSNVARGQGPEA